MSRTVKAWIGMAIGGTLVALALLAGANWRGLRDGWRVNQVKAHPDYPQLKAKWQRIAGATEKFCWPDDGTRRKMPQYSGRIVPYRFRPAWEGAAVFLGELGPFTDRAERKAYWDFGPQRGLGLERLHSAGEENTFRELVAMRARGGLSDGTFSRAMLILVRHRNCFLHGKHPGALRVGLRILCDLVDDGEPRVAHQPARDLQEAIEDAAKSQQAALVCDKWKNFLSANVQMRRAREISSGRLHSLPPERPVYEKNAYKSLAVLGQTSVGMRVRDHGKAHWAKGLSAKAEETVPPYEFLSVGRAGVVRAIDGESLRLPAELRGPFCAAAGRLFDSRAVHDICHELSDPTAAREVPSPTLRLIVEMIRNNP